MNIYPIDTSLRSSLSFIDSNVFTSIQYTDDRKRDRLLIELLINNLLKAKKSLIISDSIELKTHLLQTLAKLKLSNLTQVLDFDQDLSEKELYKLKALAKSNPENQISFDYQVDKKLYELEVGNLTARFSYLTDKQTEMDCAQIFNDFVEMHIDSNQTGAASKDILQDELVVSNMANLYKPVFDLYANNDLFSMHFFEALSGEGEVIAKVNALFEEIISIQKNWHLIHDEMIEHLENEIEASFYKIEQAAHKLEQFIITNQDKYIASKASKSLLQKISKTKKAIDFSQVESAYNLLQTELLHDQEIAIDFDNIVHCLNGWKLEKDQFHQNRKAQINAQIRQINCRNADEVKIHELNERFNSFIEEYSTSGLFKSKPENNAWNFSGQLNAIQKIAKELRNSIYLIDHTQYIPFRILQNEASDLFKKEFEHFKTLDADTWLIEYQTLKAKHKMSSITNSKLPEGIQSIKQIETAHQNWTEKTCIYLQDHWGQNRKLALKKFAKSNKHVSNQLFKKSKPYQAKWSEILSLNDSFLLDFFPITFSEKLPVQDGLCEQWDQVIFINRPDLLSSNTIATLGTKAVSLIDQQLMQNDVQAEDNEVIQEFHLRGALCPTFNSTFDLDEKINCIDIITQQIRQLTKDFSIFQIKDGVIITFLGGAKANLLLQNLSHLSAKEASTFDHEEDLLQEILMFDVQHKYLILNNGLICSDQYENWAWQNEIISNLEILGFKVINLDDKTLAQDGIKPIQNLAGKITDAINMNSKNSIPSS